MLDITPMAEVLKGVEYELYDCALANLVGRLHPLPSPINQKNPNFRR